MAVGKKYLKYYESVRTMFERYAKKCNAELIVHTTPPDSTFKRSILAQKMLLPELYREYEWIAFFDLDILISENSPSIFEQVDESKAFSAVVDPRGTQKFNNAVMNHWRMPSILNETHYSYFIDRGFPGHIDLCGSINGGVFLCKPGKISNRFKDFYFSNFPEVSHEEAIMAYVAQTNNLFFELNEKFNNQFIYLIYEDLDNDIIGTINSGYFKLLIKLHNYLRLPSWAYPPSYKQFIKNKLQDNNYVVHFSGGFPFINAAT